MSANNYSRTARSVKNAKVALFFYCINLLLQFFSRKIFLEYLGAEVLGLNTTAQNLIEFLNLAELGIGSAVGYSLYKPLFERNYQAINEIVSVQGWLYRKIAYFVISGACILMFFFPLIFEKAEVPLWYTYGTFIALLVSALLGYFINYRQIVFSADQQEYKVTLNIQGFKFLKILLQIAAVYYLSNGYVYWMLLEILISVLTAYLLNRLLKHEYPWLKSVPKSGKELSKKYPEIIKKTKQLFFHKIASFVLTQTSPLVIYAYTSLTLVAIYGNYMLIVMGAIYLMNALFNSIGAGVGNLIAEGNKKRIKAIFWELASFRIWVASIICFGIYKLGHYFIILWVGQEYIMEQSAFIILIFITFVGLTRTHEPFLFGYGLFQDIWSPIVETILNLGLSIVLGYYYGLTGILSGVAISLLLIVCSWKPYFLYRWGFKEKISEYICRYLKYILLLAISFIVTLWTLNLFSSSVATFIEWGIYALIVLLSYTLFSGFLFVLFDTSYRNMCKRMLSFIKRKY